MAIKFTPYNKSTPFGVPDYATAAARDQAVESQNMLGIAGVGVEGAKGIWGEDPYLKDGYNKVKDKLSDFRKGIDGEPTADDLAELDKLSADMEGLGDDMGAPIAEAQGMYPEAKPMGGGLPQTDLSAGLREPDMLGMAMGQTTPQLTDLASTTTSDLLRNTGTDLAANVGTDLAMDVGTDLATDAATSAASSSGGGNVVGSLANMGMSASQGDYGGMVKDALVGLGNFVFPGSGFLTGPALDYLAPTEGNAEREQTAATELRQGRRAEEIEKQKRMQRRYA